MALIPGAGEFVYATEVVTEDDGDGTTSPQNAHNAARRADIDASLDELRRWRPISARCRWSSAGSASDLRAGHARIKPGVEIAAQDHLSRNLERQRRSARATPIWSARSTGAPAYGGTPSDDSVVAAIAESEGARLARACSVRSCSWTSRRAIRCPIPTRTRRRKPPIPGAAASPARRRRACRIAGPDPGRRDAGERVLRQRQRGRFLGERHKRVMDRRQRIGAIAAWCCIMRSSVRGGGRRRCVS